MRVEVHFLYTPCHSRECKYEVVALRGQIAELTTAKDAEIDKLSKKLG